MSDSSAKRLPRRILDRATGLLNVNFAQEDSSTEYSLTRLDTILGSSIKRKFKEVKEASVARGKSDGATRWAQNTSGEPDSLGGQSSPDHPSPRPSAAGAHTRSKNMADVSVPPLLQQGTPMTKVSARKQKQYVFRLDPDQGQIIWESEKLKIIPIESIKELRTCSDARYYREQFQLSPEYEERWLTIIYIMEGQYKTLHLIASTPDVFRMWDITLRKLHAIRQELMSGLGNMEMRQAVWERQYWKGADEQSDQKLSFEEVEKLCKRLNINSSTENLLRLFKEADRQNRGFLDFPDFQRFVKLLKARPELDRIFLAICSENDGKFDFRAFERFMRQSQKSPLSQADLERIFEKYASTPIDPLTPTPSSISLPSLEPESKSHRITSRDLVVPRTDLTTWTLEGFTSFLLSAENSAFSDQHGKIWHDMTRPMSDYYISSSHNTYLVGHQLVGVSTIEGYIRALLHSCRSVEVDVYDGDQEPMIYHGKTLTSKVSLRQVCQAIAKYAFVTSPYPIVISAEVHCSIPQQDMMVEIMQDVFGDALVSAPVDGRPKIETLPSPEELKGRILLKAKGLHVSENERLREKDVTVDTESSTETSESEVMQDLKHEWRRAKESEPVKELKHEFEKARNAIGRRIRSSSPSPSVASTTTATVAIASGPVTVSSAFLQPPNSSAISSTSAPPLKVKMSFALASLLVYTVGVKCRGLNKKEHYAPEHIFSLSENTANKIIRQGLVGDLIKHNRTHIVRIYPKGLRLNSTNYEPHRYWAVGAQLVAINWQTFDLGYMINHSMFQRNGRSGYVLKPLALRTSDKDLLCKRTRHFLEVTIISAQQLPRPKDSSGREIIDKSIPDPYVEVSLHVPDWSATPFFPASTSTGVSYDPASTPSISSFSSTSSGSSAGSSATTARMLTARTRGVRNNGFNPLWQETLCIPFDCASDMRELVFVRFTVRQDGREEADGELAVYCVSLGSLQLGFRHLPLHDAQLSQYLFSTLFVNINIQDV